MSKRIVIFVALALMAFSPIAGARDIHSKAGTSAFPFLKINVGARAVAMGGAFTGLADDETALYYNPAGIAGMEHKRFVLGYHNYFVDIQSGFTGFIFPLDETNSLGAYVSYLNYGEFTATDSRGDATGETFGGGDLMVAFSYARLLSNRFRIGGSAKFIYEKLDEFSASGAAVDLGAKYVDDRERLGLGLMVQNLGAQLSSLGQEKFDLPLTFRGGLSYKPVGLPLTLVADGIAPVDNNFDIAIGAEYHELKPFYIRLGWSSFGSNYKAADSKDAWAGVSLGFGLDVQKFHIGYALQSAADLGNTHRITFTGTM
ncbi:MAG: PorV/PorQ family protein [bacterium]